MRKHFLLNTLLVVVSLSIVMAVMEVTLATFFPQATVDVVYKNNPAIFLESDILPYALTRYESGVPFA